MLVLSQAYVNQSKSKDFTVSYYQLLVGMGMCLHLLQGARINRCGRMQYLWLKRYWKNMGWVILRRSDKFDPFTYFNNSSNQSTDPTTSLVKSRIMIIVSYVNDCIIISKSKKSMHSVFVQLDTMFFIFTDEGNASKHL